MKLSQIIIIEANEPDYTGIDDNIRERLSNYKSHEQQWALKEIQSGKDISRVEKALKHYRQNISNNNWKNILEAVTDPINPKNLLQITTEQIEYASRQYDITYNQTSKREILRALKRQYTTKLIDEPDLILIKIEKTDATHGATIIAQQYAQNTKWCISDPTTAEEYLELGPLYYIEYNGFKYLCHTDTGTPEFTNASDDQVEINKELCRRLRPYIPKVGIFISNVPSAYKEGGTATNDEHSQESTQVYLDAVKQHPKLATRYAMEKLHQRWPEAEQHILSDPQAAYTYAKNVIKNRWPEAERTIFSKNNDIDEKSNQAWYTTRYYNWLASLG